MQWFIYVSFPGHSIILGMGNNKLVNNFSVLARNRLANENFFFFFKEFLFLKYKIDTTNRSHHSVPKLGCSIIIFLKENAKQPLLIY